MTHLMPLDPDFGDVTNGELIGEVNAGVKRGLSHEASGIVSGVATGGANNGADNSATQSAINDETNGVIHSAWRGSRWMHLEGDQSFLDAKKLEELPLPEEYMTPEQRWDAVAVILADLTQQYLREHPLLPSSSEDSPHGSGSQGNMV